MLERVVAASASPASSSTPASKLRAILHRPGCVTVPACYDALSARLIARSGPFDCAFMSGYGVSAARMGDPDVGLASLDAMADAGRHICRTAGSLPIIGDGDTGFGGVANVRRTVFEYHRAGFAAVTIEDQVFPKRCAFAAGVNVVSRKEALARLAAALGEITSRPPKPKHVTQACHNRLSRMHPPCSCIPGTVH